MLEARPKPLLSRTEAKAAEFPTLYQFIPRLGRAFGEPKHLDPLVRSLEAAWTRPIYQTAHAPPRHAKTDTVLAWAALTLRRQPWRTVAYISYEAHIARSKSRKARAWYLGSGGRLADAAASLSEWRTPEGGGFLSGGIGGPLTSQGVDILVIDDPYKHRQQAESAAYRQMVADWWGDVGETRIEPGGSAFIFHTRWTTDDLIGHVLEGEGGDDWEPHIRLPAIDDSGQPLWPERWSAEALDRKRRSGGEYTWLSLYQGLPRPRGGAVFRDVYYYDELPKTYRVGVGVDLAYTARTHADYSVAVVLAESGGNLYVLDVKRMQVDPPQFAGVLRSIKASYPGARFHSFMSSTERGIADLLRAEGGVPIVGELASSTGDKFVRAQPAAAAWNDGKVFVPRSAPWLEEFIREVSTFSGVGDRHDDQVDALASAFTLIRTLGVPVKPPKPRPPIYRFAGTRGF